MIMDARYMQVGANVTRQRPGETPRNTSLDLAMDSYRSTHLRLYPIPIFFRNLRNNLGWPLLRFAADLRGFRG